MKINTWYYSLFSLNMLEDLIWFRRLLRKNMSFKKVSFILHYIRRLLKIVKMWYFYQKACHYIVKFVYKLRPWISISYIDLSFIQNEFM